MRVFKEDISHNLEKFHFIFFTTRKLIYTVKDTENIDV